MEVGDGDKFGFPGIYPLLPLFPLTLGTMPFTA